MSERKKMSSSQNPSGRDINGYLPARLVEGAKWYIEFYCFDPDLDAMRRKRLYVPFISPKTERRKYAQEMIRNVNTRLSSGWNPFLRLSDPKEYTVFKDVCEAYARYQLQLSVSDERRKKTYYGYTSMLSTFRKWNDEQPKPVVFIYQLKRSVIDEFLDWLWISEQKTARTRDNYLSFFRTFCKWMQSKGYISEDPTAGLQMVQGKRKVEKNRAVIPKEEMLRLRAYLEKNDRHFLLACYILYYCFIRPNEMAHLKIGDVNVMKGTISVDKSFSKNRRSQVVTVPDHVMHLMIDLHVLEVQTDYFLFGRNCRPGREFWMPKYFCDRWKRVAKALGFPAEYKFYSLKDTGITDMIRSGEDLLAVRDQARHSSLQMTDLYTPLTARESNASIRKLDGYF